MAPRVSPLPRGHRGGPGGGGQGKAPPPPPQSAGRPWGSQGLQAIRVTAGRCSQGVKTSRIRGGFTAVVCLLSLPVLWSQDW